MIAIDFSWGGTDVIQDTPPHDPFPVVYAPSLVTDILGAVPQLDSMSSAAQFMQQQFRMATENMMGAGTVINEWS